ncbi:hypothetical protein Trydic_g19761 [Trypoxylus dichotomus]
MKNAATAAAASLIESGTSQSISNGISPVHAPIIIVNLQSFSGHQKIVSEMPFDTRSAHKYVRSRKMFGEKTFWAAQNETFIISSSFAFFFALLRDRLFFWHVERKTILDVNM